MAANIKVNEEILLGNQLGRDALAAWQQDLRHNCYDLDRDFKHSVDLYLSKSNTDLSMELSDFGDKVVNQLEPLVIENNLAINLPRLESYDAIGRLVSRIIHHPSYVAAGDIIYSSRLMARMAKPGGLLEAMAFMFLSSQAGEAGHNCPIACSAGIIRVLQKIPDWPQRSYYLNKLIQPSYQENYTGAQFLTEIQGGSDVGSNATLAYRDAQNHWRIRGEKWFCSNANADLILITARFDEQIPGTKGLGLFLIPKLWEAGTHNHYVIRRLKDKIGTRSMASGEIDFHDAYAIAMGPPEDGFKMVMENVLHLSRLFNTFCMLGMARRAYYIAYYYANHRVAFGQSIVNYPLVQENLARIKAENNAMIAAIFATTQLQDDYDTGKITGEDNKLLLRLLANLNKYISALWSVEHIHHALDVLAGNGAIESFSTIPRLLRDSIVCENWEGTHNTLRMQILRDILRYQIDAIFLSSMQKNIAMLNADDKYLKAFNHCIQKLITELQQLKTSLAESQSLQIKTVVNTMATLFCAVQLLKEAMAQATAGNNSKLHCLDYFILLHLNELPIEYNNNYLMLIKHINEN